MADAILVDLLTLVHGSLGEEFHQPKVEGVITQNEEMHLWPFICDGLYRREANSPILDFVPEFTRP